jgi:hypothetical protein
VEVAVVAEAVEEASTAGQPMSNSSSWRKKKKK